MESSLHLVFAHPLIQSAVVPLTLSITLTAVMRFRGPRLGFPRGGGLGIGLAFVLSAWLITGGELSGALSAVQKLTLLSLIGLLMGALLEFLAVSSSTLRGVATVFFLAAAFWIAWPQLQRDALDWPVAALVLAGSGLLFGLARPVERRGPEGLPLLLAAVGIAAVCVVSGSLLIAQLAGALAMASLGFLVWNWPRSRDLLGPSVLLGATLPLLLLALITVLLTRAPVWALAPLAALFFLAPAARLIPAPRARWRDAVQSIFVLILGCVPIAIAVVLALSVETPDDPYYP